MNKKWILITVLLLAIPSVMGGGYMESITKGLADRLYCALTGCTMTGDLNMGGNQITNATNITVTLVNATSFINEVWVNESGDTMTGPLNVTDSVAAHNFTVPNSTIKSTVKSLEFSSENKTLRIDLGDLWKWGITFDMLDHNGAGSIFRWDDSFMLNTGLQSMII